MPPAQGLGSLQLIPLSLGKLSHVRPRCPLPLVKAPVTSGSWPIPSPTVSFHEDPSPLAQGSALPDSGDFRKPGSEFKALTTSPNVSYPAVGYTAQP